MDHRPENSPGSSPQDSPETRTQTVLVTGASSGIGRACALALAERGTRLALLARREDELLALARECRAIGAPDVTVHVVDVADRGAVEGVFARLPRCDAVVHSAAVAAYGRFADVPGPVFDRVQEINLLGAANVARAALRGFERQGSGHLVLVGSVVGKLSAPYLSPYVTSKWALQGLAHTLQAEVRRPLRVSLVEPGGVDTGLYRKAANHLGREGKPPPPVMSAERVARAILGVLDRPRQERSVGPLNPLLTWGFRLAPRLFDLTAGRVMSRLGISDDEVPATDGNVFHPLPEPQPDPQPDSGQSQEARVHDG